MTEINPRAFGQLEAKVQHLTKRLEHFDDKVDRLDNRIEKLTSLIDQAKGARLVLMLVIAVPSFVAGVLATLKALRPAVLALIALPALAHQAPSGWDYDRECCHNLDCAPVRDGLIREVAGGYQVMLRAGQHPMLRGEARVDLFIPHGDRRIRVSGDPDRHACVTGAGHVFCIYVPPGGV